MKVNKTEEEGKQNWIKNPWKMKVDNNTKKRRRKRNIQTRKKRVVSGRIAKTHTR